MTTSQQHPSPWLIFAATAVAVLGSYFAFIAYPISPSYHFAPIMLLAVLYASVNFARQLRGRSEYSIKMPADLGTLFGRALGQS